MKDLYTIKKQLEKKGITVKYETTEEYLKKGGKIKDVTGVVNDNYSDINRKIWVKGNIARKGNGTIQRQEFLDRLSEII